MFHIFLLPVNLLFFFIYRMHRIIGRNSEVRNCIKCDDIKNRLYMKQWNKENYMQDKTNLIYYKWTISLILFYFFFEGAGAQARKATLKKTIKRLVKKLYLYFFGRLAEGTQAARKTSIILLSYHSYG